MNETIIDYLKASFPSLQAIYLFGSYANGTEQPQSDVDIAFLCEESVDNLERWKVSESPASQLNQDVDLVDLTNTSEVLRMQVVGKGKRIYVRDEVMVEAFEDRVYMLYIDLNENRAVILEDIAKRGSVY